MDSQRIEVSHVSCLYGFCQLSALEVLVWWEFFCCFLVHLLGSYVITLSARRA